MPMFKFIHIGPRACSVLFYFLVTLSSYTKKSTQIEIKIRCQRKSKLSILSVTRQAWTRQLRSIIKVEPFYVFALSVNLGTYPCRDGVWSEDPYRGRYTDSHFLTVMVPVEWKLMENSNTHTHKCLQKETAWTLTQGNENSALLVTYYL